MLPINRAQTALQIITVSGANATKLKGYRCMRINARPNTTHAAAALHDYPATRRSFVWRDYDFFQNFV